MNHNYKNLTPTIMKVDILIFCYFIVFNKTKFRKNNRTSISEIIKYLSKYDHFYTNVDPLKIRKEFVRLFPLRKYNHKNTKSLKINKSLVLYWGNEFNINYQLHKESINVFRNFQEANRMSF